MVTPTFINEVDLEHPLMRARWLLDGTQHKQSLANANLRWRQAIGPLVPIFTPTGTLGSCSPWRDLVSYACTIQDTAEELIKVSARRSLPEGDEGRFPLTRVKR